MQRTIKDRQMVDDRWHLLPKDTTLESVPDSDGVIIPLVLWLEHGPALRDRDDGLGVWPGTGEGPESIAGDLDRSQVITLSFPAFTDGRGFSNTRLLRERYDYEDEVRAVGDVLRNQLFSMCHCDFNVYAIRADRNPENALTNLDDLSRVYQTSVKQPLPLFRRRG